MGRYWDYAEAGWAPSPSPASARPVETAREAGLPEPRTAVESEDEADVRSG